MPEQPDKLAHELRSAVLAGDHACASRLVPEYALALKTFWESLPESQRADSSVPSQACELLAWAREMTLVQRALTAEHLAVVEKASRYRATPGAESCPSAIEVRA